ncbi:MAG: LysR family transcriptional regulator [Pseudaminobacter sp.]|nr:LysR family transcriptional regulator [Pseudaminobacter sp.]
MPQRLPPLHALRIFECVAQLESFTRAGEELGLTQSAVSKQVALLEAHLGHTLFKRLHRRIELTESGRIVARAVRTSLATLAARLDEVNVRPPKQIRIVADADFAQLWLFPRLPAFERIHPDLRLSIRSETSLKNLPDEGYDCALLWGRGDWRNCKFEPLFANAAFPVAAPGYFAYLGRPPRMTDLTSSMLIHDRSSHWWATILAAEGSADIDPEFGRVYNQTVLCLEAAARGDGVTVGDEVTTRSYLESGRLVAPFAVRLPSPDAYYVIRPSTDTHEESMELFRVWLDKEANEHRKWFSAFWR